MSIRIATNGHEPEFGSNGDYCLLDEQDWPCEAVRAAATASLRKRAKCPECGYSVRLTKRQSFEKHGRYFAFDAGARRICPASGLTASGQP